MNHTQLFPQLLKAGVLAPAKATPLAPVINHVIAADAMAKISRGAAVSINPGAWVDIERSLLLDPIGTLARRFRVKPVGSAMDGTGTVFTATPQERVIPLRLVMPSADGALNVSNLQCALKRYQADAASVPAAMFDVRNLEGGWLRPLVCEVGNTVTGRFSGAASAPPALLCAVIGDQAIPAPAGDLRMMGAVTGAIAAGGSVTVTFRPEVRCRVRKLVLAGLTDPFDDLAKLYVTQFLVGVKDQLESVDAITSEFFSASSIAMWLDGDVAEIGQSIPIVIQNADATNPSHSIAVQLYVDAIDDTSE